MQNNSQINSQSTTNQSVNRNQSRSMSMGERILRGVASVGTNVFHGISAAGRNVWRSVRRMYQNGDWIGVILLAILTIGIALPITLCLLIATALLCVVALVGSVVATIIVALVRIMRRACTFVCILLVTMVVLNLCPAEIIGQAPAIGQMRDLLNERTEIVCEFSLDAIDRIETGWDDFWSSRVMNDPEADRTFLEDVAYQAMESYEDLKGALKRFMFQMDLDAIERSQR